MLMRFVFTGRTIYSRQTLIDAIKDKNKEMGSEYFRHKATIHRMYDYYNVDYLVLGGCKNSTKKELLDEWNHRQGRQIPIINVDQFFSLLNSISSPLDIQFVEIDF